MFLDEDTDLLFADIMREPAFVVYSFIDTIDYLFDDEPLSYDDSLPDLLNMAFPLNCLILPSLNSVDRVLPDGLLAVYRLILP